MVNSPKLILIGGGVRSGKSAFALSLALGLGERRVFLATAEALDDEMRERIEAHRRDRDGMAPGQGEAFETVEEPLDLPGAVARLRDRDVAVVDCLTLWISNLLLRGDSHGRILEQVDALLAALEERALHAVLVTNEVGMGVVPASASGRAFRDVCGAAHSRISRAADEVYLAVLGTVLRIKPSPLAVPPE
ncbi:MAG: bifunctional adenosylcobinamide kinase/adenosylcobinamide-phosphate guanylyltransferase [bacterium]